MKLLPNFPIERIEEILANPSRFRLLEEVALFSLNAPLVPAQGDELPIVFMDTETTGTDVCVDRIIQLGMVKGYYSPSLKRLQRVTDTYCEYEDPGAPIPTEASRVNKIYDADVAGKSFDEAKVEAFVADDPLMICHNTFFDCPLWCRRFPWLANLRFGCTYSEIDWRGEDFEGSGLGPIVMQSGRFFNGHKALDDCLALADLMHREPWAFEQLIDNAMGPSYSVAAVGCPIELKDHLAKRRYRWNPAPRKVWEKEGVRDIDAEIEFLDNLYGGGQWAQTVLQTARDRFRKRDMPPLRRKRIAPADAVEQRSFEECDYAIGIDLGSTF